MTKDYDAVILRQEIAALEQNLITARSQLKQAEARCNHDWAATEYTPERKEGYTIPADYCGSDSRPACHVPPETIKIWSRRCTKCDRIETTTDTRPKMVSGIIPGTTAEANLPYFPEQRGRMG